MELSIDAGYQRFAWGDQILDPFFGKEKGAALKLVRSKLEEHVGRFMLFDLDQNRSALGNCCARSNTPPGRATAVPSF